MITDWKKGERFEIFGEVFEVVRVDKAGRKLSAQTVHRDKVRDSDFLMGGKTFHIRDLVGIARPFDKDRWERMYGKSMNRLEQLRREAGLREMPSAPVLGGVPDRSFFKALVKSHRYGHGSLTSVEKAAMEEAVGSRGGYTVPTEYTNDLFQTIAESSLFWPRARVLTMGSLELQVPVPDFTTAQSAGTTALFGGLLFQFGQGAAGNEGQEITEDEPQFRQIVLHAWDLIGLAVASNQYIDDLLARPDGESRLLQLFGQAAAWYADYSFFRGTGAARSMPLGILNAGCKLTVPRAGAGHIAQADVAGMAAKLLPNSWNTAIWCISPSAVVDLVKITNFQQNEDASRPDGMIGLLYTRPVYVTEKLPALGTSGDLVLFDPQLYVIGDRQQPEVAVSRDTPTAFQRSQTCFRTWMRVDGKPLLNEFVTLADGTSTASSVVVITT